jgi:hypothetical protein
MSRKKDDDNDGGETFVFAAWVMEGLAQAKKKSKRKRKKFSPPPQKERRSYTVTVEIKKKDGKIVRRTIIV